MTAGRYVNSEKAPAIVAKLLELELERKIRIIYAVEHGSRRWGLNGPNSDHDVGFIYVNPLDWYLKVGDHRDKSLDSERDNIKIEVPGLGDLQGWDLKKTLNAMHKGDPMLSEWLHAPEAYIEDPWSVLNLKNRFRECWSPLKYYHRNVSTAKKNYHEYVCRDHHPDTAEGYVVKKWMHTLRPLLNALWMEQGSRWFEVTTDIFPPADFTRLLHDLQLSKSLTNHIWLLADAKRRGGSDDVLTQPRTTLYEWMGTEIARLSMTYPADMRQEPIDVTKLDTYFAWAVKRTNQLFFESE